jgi:hypothetical protein
VKPYRNLLSFIEIPYLILSEKREVNNVSELSQILLERLKKKEMDPSLIPGFIRDLANTVLVNPPISHLQVNKHLHLLGWDDFELDYHTLQLAIACFEAEGLAISENVPHRFAEIVSKVHKGGPDGQLIAGMTA